MRCRCIFIFVLMILAAGTGHVRADSTGSGARRRVVQPDTIVMHDDHGADRPDVIIAVRPDAPLSRLEDLIVASNGTISRSLGRTHAIAASIPRRVLTRVAAHRDVVSIEPDSRGSWLDVELDRSWGVRQTGAGHAHAAHITGQGVRVAVLDKGIDARHPEFNDTFRGGWDFIDNDPNPFVARGGAHGTHVSGALCAADDGVGVVGASPGCDLYLLRIGDHDGPKKSAVIAALEWCIEHDMHVTNSSFGFFGDSGRVLRDAYDDAWRHGILHVAAAGNTGRSFVGIPAQFESVIAVGAIDHRGRVASFSARGPEIELVAPGVGIPTVDGSSGYTLGMGTSIAAPHVAGAAALVIASGTVQDENGNGRINDEVRARLASSAVDLDAPGWDSHTGFGQVNAWRAIEGNRE